MMERKKGSYGEQNKRIAIEQEINYSSLNHDPDMSTIE